MSGALDDYSWLRHHIHGQFTLITQVFTASVIAASALLGYLVKVMADGSLVSNALIQDKATSIDFSFAPFLFLTPLFIVIPCTFLLASLRKEIFHWGMYIKVYLEGGQRGGWETELYKYRRKFRERESFNQFAMTYLGFLIACCLLFWWGLRLTEMHLIYLLVLLIPVIFFARWYSNYRDIPFRYSMEYESNWLQIKNEGKRRKSQMPQEHDNTLNNKLDEIHDKLGRLIEDNKTFQKHQAIFGVALSALGLAVSLIIFASQSTYKYLVYPGIGIWCVAIGCFFYLFISTRRIRPIG